MNIIHYRRNGFTLVEMIVVMVITGILGGMVAIFIRAPVQGYVDSARRAELTDIADTAVRRMARDVRTAVPNSIRTAGCGVGVPCVEYLPTRDGGRYRAKTTAAGAGDILEFGVSDGSFGILGSAINFTASDYIVIGSTQTIGDPAYDVSVNGILRAYTGGAGSKTSVTMNNTALPAWAELSSQRFDVVDGAQQAVTYACVGILGALDANLNGRARLMRYSNYGFYATQQTPAGIAANAAPVASHTEAVLADKVSACAIDYDVPNQRFGLVAVRLTLTSANESVYLYNEIHVNNEP